MLVHVHKVRYQEGDIVVHTKIHRFPNGRDLNQSRIRIIRPVHCVIKTERPVLVLLVAKYEAEQSVLIFSFHLGQIVHLPYRLQYITDDWLNQVVSAKANRPKTKKRHRAQIPVAPQFSAGNNNLHTGAKCYNNIVLPDDHLLNKAQCVILAVFPHRASRIYPACQSEKLIVI